MKKLFTLLFAAALFVACNNTKTDKVETDPATIGMYKMILTNLFTGIELGECKQRM